MNQKNITNLDSILETKASGCLNVENDLDMPDGKAIAELIYDQETQTKAPAQSS